MVEKAVAESKGANFESRAIGHFGVYRQQLFKVIYKGGFYFGGPRNTS
jgi:hypothetical protein